MMQKIVNNSPVPSKKKIIYKCPLLSVPSVLEPLDNGIVELAVVEDTIHEPPTAIAREGKSNLHPYFNA